MRRATTETLAAGRRWRRRRQSLQFVRDEGEETESTAAADFQRSRQQFESAARDESRNSVRGIRKECQMRERESLKESCQTRGEGEAQRRERQREKRDHSQREK